MRDDPVQIDGPFHPVIVAPTFGHAPLLRLSLGTLEPLDPPVIVIDDGSRDATGECLAAWRAADPVSRIVITHAQNRGKADALRSGFGEASRRGFTHAVTIDTDGQHDGGDLPALIELARAHPHAIVIGARARRIPGYPARGRLGRALSNHFVWLAGGLAVADSQSGMRVYPLGAVERLRPRARRYAFETEILTRAGWAGIPVIEAPIGCVYRVPGGRVSHFRVCRDTAAAVAMHMGLLGRSLLPGDPVPRLAGRGSAPTGTLFRRAARWFAPRGIVRMARGDSESRERLAASVATGLFMATIPAYGVKTIACLWLSARLRLHPLVVIAVSSLSTPPIGFVFVLISVVCGHLLLRGTVLDTASLPDIGRPTFAGMSGFVLEWLVGSLVAGSVLAFAAYWVVRWGLTRGRAAPVAPGAAGAAGAAGEG